MPPVSAVLFLLGALAVYLVLLRHAWKTAPFLAFVLVLIVPYDYVTEFVGLRSGLYYYGAAPLRICLGSHPTGTGSCAIPDQCIPLAVLLMEASILLAVMRTTDLLSLPRFAKPFLDALIAVNIDVMLDPIASSSQWCGTGEGPSFGGLGFWTWLTRGEAAGLWFGVPLFNYIAWFTDNFAFVVGVRLIAHFFQKGQRGKTIDFFAAVGAIGVILVIEGVLDLVLRWLLDLRYTPAWQWGVIGGIFGLSVLVVLSSLRALRHDHPVQWPLVAVPGFYFAFGLGALLLSPSLAGQPALYLVWAICFVIGSAHALSPYWRALRR